MSHPPEPDRRTNLKTAITRHFVDLACIWLAQGGLQLAATLPLGHPHSFHVSLVYSP